MVLIWSRCQIFAVFANDSQRRHLAGVGESAPTTPLLSKLGSELNAFYVDGVTGGIQRANDCDLLVLIPLRSLLIVELVSRSSSRFENVFVTHAHDDSGNLLRG